MIPELRIVNRLLGLNWYEKSSPPREQPDPEHIDYVTSLASYRPLAEKWLKSNTDFSTQEEDC